MGFPIGYSDFFLRKLLHVLFLFCYLRRIIHCSFRAFGLGDLIDSEGPWPDQSSVVRPHPEFRSVPALLIEELLPVVKYEELSSDHLTTAEENCAVCLCGLERMDEVRRLGNCRHVFHRVCIDRWMEHEQRTCPLCRTPLVPDELQEAAFDHCFWAAAGIPDSYSLSELSLD